MEVVRAKCNEDNKRSSAFCSPFRLNLYVTIVTILEAGSVVGDGRQQNVDYYSKRFIERFFPRKAPFENQAIVSQSYLRFLCELIRDLVHDLEQSSSYISFENVRTINIRR